jgi:hypothetical protein
MSEECFSLQRAIDAAEVRKVLERPLLYRLFYFSLGN